MYGFVPERLYVAVGDYIHFQWTGCDTNPAGNAGEGTDQTDRSNIVQIATFDSNTPVSNTWLQQNTPLFQDIGLQISMSYINQDLSVCLNYATLLADNNNNANEAEQDTRNCMLLNAAPTPYFDGGAIKMNVTTGESTPFYYMSSRNNNFSNRGQKGAIFVLNELPNPNSTVTCTTGTSTTTTTTTTTGKSVSGGHKMMPFFALFIVIMINIIL